VVDEAAVLERTSRIAVKLRENVAELTADLVERYEQDIPPLRDDERMMSLLASSVFQNLETAMSILEHSVDIDAAEAPAAAMEYARRLAQRGVAVVDLIRAYHIGQTAVVEHLMAEADRQIEDRALLADVMKHLVAMSFGYIYRVTNDVVTAYEEERDRWLRGRSAMRAAQVRAVLDAETVDVDASEAALGYRLRGTHVGLIAWRAGNSGTENALSELERLAVGLAKRANCTTNPLVVPCDEASAWVWLPLTEAKPPPRKVFDEALAEGGGNVRIALGEPAQDVAGFRRTHRQALRVQALGLAAGDDCDPVMSFSEVGSVALMVSDIDSAHAWVVDTLGPLATHDAQHQRLRETLRVFLAAGRSYTAAAATLTMHKNSVQYRVRKAEELLGRAITDNRMDVELALTLCRWLGSAVLTSP
jgi:hypothetical protein